jgi:hypothetical protein
MNTIADKNLEQIINKQYAIEQLAKNLADWFGRERQLPLEHTGVMIVETRYVETIISEINRNFTDIIALTNDWELPNV